MTALVSLDGLTIRAPTRHLIRDVSLEVHPKEVTALVGPSGAGKSLTARAVMCVLDVSPGLESGSLRYPALDPDKDWYEGVRGEGMRAQKRLLEQTRPLRGAWFTYSPQAATSQLLRQAFRSLPSPSSQASSPSRTKPSPQRARAHVVKQPSVFSALPSSQAS